MGEALRSLKALADETRLRLALVLYRYELSVNELVTLLDMGQSRVSRHLKILAEAGLLSARRDGLWVFYSAARNGQHGQFLAAVLPFALEEGAAEADLEKARHILEERSRKTRQFFNAIAEDWDALNSEILGEFSLPEAVLTMAPPNSAVGVDLGCGTGEVLEELRKVCTQIIGVDGSPRMLDLARRRLGDEAGLSLRIGELDHLPLRDGEADFACINLVLHHLSDPVTALEEIARVLCPGGLLLITDFDRHSLEDMRLTYGDRWLGFDRHDLEQALEKAGFEPDRYSHQNVNKGLALHLVLARKKAAQ